jgi:hypothetical protein
MEDAVDDSLHFINDKDISNIVGDDDKMLLSYKVIKINRYGLSQERNMIVTKKNIYNLKKKGK